MVTAKNKKENYSTEISNGNSVILSDVTKEGGGNGIYFRPHELLCAGLASCINITVRMILDRMKLPYDDVIVSVDLDKSEDGKAHFIYDVDIKGNIDAETREKILEKLKRSPVKKTLESDISVTQKNN